MVHVACLQTIKYLPSNYNIYHANLSTVNFCLDNWSAI